MCLFAINRDQTCDHEECIEFYRFVSKSIVILGPNPVDQLGKRSQRNESSESEESSKKIVKTRSLKPAVAQQAAESDRILESEAVYMGEGVNYTEDEQRKGNKMMIREPEFNRAHFKPPFQRQQPQNEHMSSFNGFYSNPTRAGVTQQPTRTQQQFTPSNLNTKSAFHPYPSLDDSPSNNINIPSNIIINELKNQSRMMTEILEKVDVHNKMLSILIKDYQFHK